MRNLLLTALTTTIVLASGCSPSGGGQADRLDVDSVKTDPRVRNSIYVPVKLTTDLSVLSEQERKMIPLLISAANIMDSLFWEESWGRPDSVPMKDPDMDTKRFFHVNYGPWDRLAGDTPFIDGVGPRPKGAQFYPKGMTAEEFDAWGDSAKKSQYTMVRRDVQGKLTAIPYHVYFKEPVNRAADLLDSAAALVTDAGQKEYLLARAKALRTDEYDASDIAWLDMRNNIVDIIIGPIETYEDQLYGYKACHEAYVLVKDTAWSAKLEHFTKLLPALQRGLPVPAAYKKEKPGSDSQLGAYDVIYYAGDANAGGKTIAVNLPNDEAIQLKKGTRRVQLKNAMRAKFDKIVVPVADLLMAEDQRKNITFDAFFQNVMFHEVAHGLGIKNTINGSGTVRDALLDEAGALEEGKADILGLYMVEQLRDKGEITGGDIMDNYVTFMASVFRSVRFGASDAHGRANMLRFNFFMEEGAMMRDPATGTYRVDKEKMHKAITDLSALILKLQGDGDIEALRALMAKDGSIKPELQKDLDRLKEANIPVDVTFEQGLDVLGCLRHDDRADALMAPLPPEDRPSGMVGERVLHTSVVFFTALLAALPLSMWAYAHLPPMALPAVAGIGIDRLILFLVISIAMLFLFKRARLLVYGVLVLGLASITLTSVLGRYGLHDLYTDYGRMLQTLGESTKALPKVNELQPFAREDEVRAAIDFRDPVVRSFAVHSATTWFKEEAEEDDDFTLVQSFSIFKVINSSWVYVSDPMDGEYFAKAIESVPLLAGDCDDHAVLMAACIKAIGGDVRLVRTTGHIYPEMNVGDAQGMQHAAYLIRNVLFPEEASHAALYYHIDAKGDRWINLDYTRHYPGGEVMDEKIVGILHV